MGERMWVERMWVEHFLVWKFWNHMKFQKELNRIGAGSKLDSFAKNQGLNENL